MLTWSSLVDKPGVDKQADQIQAKLFMVDSKVIALHSLRSLQGDAAIIKNTAQEFTITCISDTGKALHSRQSPASTVTIPDGKRNVIEDVRIVKIKGQNFSCHISQIPYHLCMHLIMTKKQTSVAQFDTLSLKEQLALLRSDGVYVGKIRRDQQVGMLFQLYSFYVEIHYRHYRKTISHLTTSSDIEVLQPYIEQVEVRGLDEKDENKA